ncbi:hypothetical protein CIB48_g10714 [Xylaria polymorpha]|nr:hypothetical protein CIB48_g10714 [Xylaria polymorpha]
MVRGRRRVLAVLYLKFAYPGRDMLQVASRVLTYLHHSHKYIELELSWAETVSDQELSRDVNKEYFLCQKELDKLPEDSEKSTREELEKRLKRLEQELYESFVLFPVANTCLFLGIVSSDWNSMYLHTVCPQHRGWVPDWGNDGMWEPGCTVVDVREGSYAFILPAENALKEEGEGQPYPALQPISGHQWLRAFGLHSENPDTDEVGDYETGEIAPVMSKEALQEVWPSFPRDDKQNSEEERDENKNGAEAPVSTKRKRESRSFDKELLMFCPRRKLDDQQGEVKIDLSRRYMQEHPERFVAGCSGAVTVLLAALTHKEECVTDLVLNKFRALSGDQVVDLVEGVAAHNAKLSTGRPKPLETLDLSFIAAVAPEHVARILDVTGGLKELIIWNNPRVGWKEVARVADGRIAKFISRAGFLAPWKNWLIKNDTRGQVHVQPAPPTAPTKVSIRQVVWMSLVAHEIDAAAPLPKHIAGPLCDRRLATLSLEDLDIQTLAMLLHPRSHDGVYSHKVPNRIFAELVALPYHDAWGALDEFYTSMRRIEKFMSHEMITEELVLGKRWPLVFPLMTATGNLEVSRKLAPTSIYVFKEAQVNQPKQFPYALSSPLPAEAFGLAMIEMSSYDKALRIRGPDPVIPGEYTLVFLREPNLGAPEWKTGEKAEMTDRNTMLLDTAAVETMWAASAALAAQKDEIGDKIYKMKNA